MLHEFISQFSSFGFGGSRSATQLCYVACHYAIAAVHRVTGFHVVTTCGSGVLDSVRVSFAPRHITIFRPTFSGSAALAARAASAVKHLASLERPLFICCPRVSCPSVLASARPTRRSWVSSGSGSWSELALSVALGVPVLVFVPSGVTLPAWGVWSAVGSASSGRWFTLESTELF